MGKASSTLKATPSMKAKKEEAADALNATKDGANGLSPSFIPGPSHSFSFAKPRRYRSTLKKDASTRNCSIPGPPNDDSGIGMDNSTDDRVSFEG